jgi:hypothetical protein
LITIYGGVRETEELFAMHRPWLSCRAYRAGGENTAALKVATEDVGEMRAPKTKNRKSIAECECGRLVGVSGRGGLPM